MKCVSLASGSKGNSYLIETNKSKILVDIGLTYKELCEKLDKLNVNPKNIDAVFISHEHSDHIKGLDTFLKENTKAKIYVHNNGADAISNRLKNGLKNEVIFYNNEFVVNDFVVSPFKLSHDSAYCSGFSFYDDKAKISIATDTGCYNQNILDSLKGSTLVYLEANHDKEMLLKNPKYPAILKRRILSDTGHLSNDASEEIIEFLTINNTQQVVLSHLSEENNSPSFAYSYIKNKLEKVGIIEGENIFIDVATQHNIGTKFNIDDN